MPTSLKINILKDSATALIFRLKILISSRCKRCTLDMILKFNLTPATVKNLLIKVGQSSTEAAARYQAVSSLFLSFLSQKTVKCEI
jgi:hypothetical protein